MAGKRLAGNRLLSTAESFTGSISSSDLLDFVEDDIWTTGTQSSAGGGVWSLRRCNGGWDRPRHVGGASLNFEAAEEEATLRRRRSDRTAREAAKSAPVSVPGWGMMGGSAEAEAEVEEEEWVPPHEYVARVHGKTAVATSVFEGVGRTLKGRDMSRVRDAVWSRTGFFG
ncbi:uncharacterized protein LOC114580282 [Dendrobium catenatum]|uniref:uncharacterized protein LOC114580282 n=1 Tax=Dendrobium catenatum TaxID=906689 RepID=UPI0010A0A7B3|nr:uncharacterized protein LOC114580282 [Dendrobium catenatum]